MLEGGTVQGGGGGERGEKNGTTVTGTESQKWRSHGGLYAGNRKGLNREKAQGIRSINGR